MAITGGFGYNPNLDPRRAQQQGEASMYGEYRSPISPPTSGYGGGRSGGGGTAMPSGIMQSAGYGGGNLPISRPAYETQQQSMLGANLSNQAFNQRWGAISPLLNRFGQPGGGVGAGPGTGMSAAEQAARAAAFGRAKDLSSQNSDAAMQGLRDAMNARGMLGSTEEARGMSNIIGGNRAGVNQFVRDQLMTDLNRAADISDTQYAGALTMRGQDVDLQRALMGLLNINLY